MKKNNFIFFCVVFVLVGCFRFMHNDTKKDNVVVNRNDKLMSAATDAGFNDENFYSCVLEASGKAAGTVLTDEELLGITELICKNKKVSDITGIEKMSNLVSLNLMENNLSNVDISNNTNLKYVVLSANKLSGVDISKNTNLVEFYASSNSLSSLNLSSNSNIERMDVSSNKISSIDLSNLSKLKSVSLSANKLSSLDVSYNVLLESLYASSNNLNSINISMLSNLINLDIHGNKLSNIDLTKNSKLDYIKVSKNGLSSLNVSNNSLVTILEANDNVLGSIDLSKNNKLIYLDLHYNKIKDINLSNNTELTHLFLSTNQLSTVDLSKNVKLEELYISSNNLTSIDISKLTNLTYFNAVLNRFNKAPSINSNNIVGLAVEANWLDEYDFDIFSKLDSLRVIDYYIIPVYGTSFDINNLSKYKSNDVTYKENVLYSDFNERGSSYIDKSSTIKGSLNGKKEYTLCATNITGYHNTCGKELSTNVEFRFDDNVVVNGIGNYSGKLFYEGYREFRFISLTSDKYVIDENKSIIDVGGDSDDVIKSNIKNSLNGSVLDINGDKLSLKYNGNVIREFTLQRVDAEKIKTGSLTLYLVIGIMIIGVIAIFVSKNVTLKNKI